MHEELMGSSHQEKGNPCSCVYRSEHSKKHVLAFVGVNQVFCEEKGWMYSTKQFSNHTHDGVSVFQNPEQNLSPVAPIKANNVLFRM